MAFDIIEDDPARPPVAALIALHLAEMRAASPACSVHAMPADRLAREDVTFWTAWDGDAIAGCGALKALGDDEGEIKSMRAAPAFRGQGVGQALLDHILVEGRLRGYRRISIETGRAPLFEPAQRLYARNGFTECGPFGDYPPDDPFSLFMIRLL